MIRPSFVCALFQFDCTTFSFVVPIKKYCYVLKNSFLVKKLFQIVDTTSRKGGGTFLVPMNGGIWTMCVSLEGILNSSLQKLFSAYTEKP